MKKTILLFFIIISLILIPSAYGVAVYGTYTYSSGLYGVGCTVDADCGLCKKCVANNCAYQLDSEDIKDECAITSYNSCLNNYIREGADGFCDGTGICDTGGNTTNVSQGNVCIDGNDAQPSIIKYCAIWADCVTGLTSAERYYVGYIGDGTAVCDVTDWQTSGTYWTARTGYTIDVTEYTFQCSSDVPVIPLDNTTLIAFISYALIFLVIYQKNRLLGNIGFILTSVGLTAYAPDTITIAIGIIILLGSLSNTIFDLLTPKKYSRKY